MIVESKIGSATEPRPKGDQGVIIAHLANNENKWGAGFVLAVNDLSLAAKFAYKALCKDHNNKVPLGITQFVEVEPNLWVANMVAQNGTDKSAVPNGCLVDYKALDQCLRTVFERAILLRCNVHIPNGMGSGLAGGDEQMIHDIIRTRAIVTPIELLERQMEFVPRITLWEFDDTGATSYVPTKTVGRVVAPVDNGVGTSDNTDIDSVLKDL